MVAVLGTLGFRPESLIPTIKSTEDVTHVVVFIGPREESRAAYEKVQTFCLALGIEVESKEIPDAFDLIGIAAEMQRDVCTLRASNETIAVFNIAGGTRLMSAAALLVCILEGLNSVYVHDDTLQEIPLPLLQIRYSEVLTPMQRTILRFLLDNRDREYSQKEIAEAMDLHKATMNHHIKELIEKGAVRLETKRGDKRTKVVHVEPSMALLLGC
jgi:CRISPR locus-related DNA-binding protein